MTRTLLSQIFLYIGEFRIANGEALTMIEPDLLADVQRFAIINRHTLFQGLEAQRIDMTLDLRMHR